MNIAIKQRLSRGDTIMDDLHKLGASLDAMSPQPAAIFCPVHETCRTQSECERVGSCLDAPKHAQDQLVALEKELNRDRLNEIAMLVRALTYGEMMELAKAVADIIASRPIEVASLTEDTMASVFHQWSGSRQ